jgi:uncharacterized protein YlzI (FlbEa/FlbD family)
MLVAVHEDLVVQFENISSLKREGKFDTVITMSNGEEFILNEDIDSLRKRLNYLATR